MLGQAISFRRYNVIILAGGAGSRMGDASEHIPKALTKLGNSRAVDYLINRYLLVADKFIIGTGHHADLLEGYVRGRYSNLPIEFSREDPEAMVNNGLSALYALDHADSRLGTIISFCDLLIVSNPKLPENGGLLAHPDTKGHLCTFRHSWSNESGFMEHEPRKIGDIDNGLLGVFVFGDTYCLKKIAYGAGEKIDDLTNDVVIPYSKEIPFELGYCDTVYEFGTMQDLQQVRKLWESV